MRLSARAGTQVAVGHVSPASSQLRRTNGKYPAFAALPVSSLSNGSPQRASTAAAMQEIDPNACSARSPGWVHSAERRRVQIVTFRGVFVQGLQISRGTKCTFRRGFCTAALEYDLSPKC